jgi:hypothetical protein
MLEEKRSKNPFIKAADAAKAVANAPKVPGSKTNLVQQAKFHTQVNNNKPSKRSTGRGR